MFLKKLKRELPYDSAILLLGIYPEKTVIQKHTRTPMSTETLFTTARTSTDRRMDREYTVHSHNGMCSSVQFSRSVVSDSLRPHDLQYAKPPCPPPTPRIHPTHVHQNSDTIQPSHPRSLPSPPAPNPSQHQSLFQ